jgi:hypothetical protein
MPQKIGAKDSISRIGRNQMILAIRPVRQQP